MNQAVYLITRELNKRIYIENLESTVHQFYNFYLRNNLPLSNGAAMCSYQWYSNNYSNQYHYIVADPCGNYFNTVKCRSNMIRLSFTCDCMYIIVHYMCLIYLIFNVLHIRNFTLL